MKFTSLAHHINKDLLMSEFCKLKRNKASGIDKVTVGEYEVKLSSNIEALVARMKSKTYRPKPVRRVYIPKPGLCCINNGDAPFRRSYTLAIFTEFGMPRSTILFST